MTSDHRAILLIVQLSCVALSDPCLEMHPLFRAQSPHHEVCLMGRFIDYEGKTKPCRKCKTQIPLYNYRFFEGRCSGCFRSSERKEFKGKL